jgi:hypothetical protein
MFRAIYYLFVIESIFTLNVMADIISFTLPENNVSENSVIKLLLISLLWIPFNKWKKKA